MRAAAEGGATGGAGKDNGARVAGPGRQVAGGRAAGGWLRPPRRPAARIQSRLDDLEVFRARRCGGALRAYGVHLLLHGRP